MSDALGAGIEKIKGCVRQINRTGRASDLVVNDFQGLAGPGSLQDRFHEIAPTPAEQPRRADYQVPAAAFARLFYFRETGDHPAALAEVLNRSKSGERLSVSEEL